MQVTVATFLGQRKQGDSEFGHPSLNEFTAWLFIITVALPPPNKNYCLYENGYLPSKLIALTAPKLIIKSASSYKLKPFG